MTDKFLFRNIPEAEILAQRTAGGLRTARKRRIDAAFGYRAKRGTPATKPTRSNPQ